jgi:soluble lytic murein transglycosylase-like protein
MFKWCCVLGLASIGVTTVFAETVYIAKDTGEGIYFSDRITDARFVSYITHADVLQAPSSQGKRQKPDMALRAKGDALQPLFNSAADAYQLHPDLVRAVAEQESRYNPKAISPKGAMGVMQLMPAVSRQYGVRNAFDPVENVNAGARYLRAMLDQFEGDTELALGAYNAGPNRVRANGNKIPQNTETKAYVPGVMQLFAMLKQKKTGLPVDHTAYLQATAAD